MHLKLLQKSNSKTGDLLGNKIGGAVAKSYDDKITSKVTSVQNTSDTVPSKTEEIGFDRKIPKGRYIFPEKRQQTIDKLRLI